MITAILIEYDVDGVTNYIGITDCHYTDTSGVAIDLWYPALLEAGSWSEQARHPYQEQGGELTVGDLVLANDGTFDFLMDADIVGMKVTRKQGEAHESFAEMEQVFIARIAGRRFEGHSVVIELDNWLAKLSGPIFTETFDSDTPNPQLVGKQIPYVLGKVTQAPVHLHTPNELGYYTAFNASLIGEVAEGGNPTQKWTLEDQPTFNLLGSPTLPITSTFEGPGDVPIGVIDDVFDSWNSGSDTVVGSMPNVDIILLGSGPSGWTSYKAQATFSTIDVTQSNGILVDAAVGRQSKLVGGASTAQSSVAKENLAGRVREEWVDLGSSIDSSGTPYATCSLGVGASDIIELSFGAADSEAEYFQLAMISEFATNRPLFDKARILADGKEVGLDIRAVLPDIVVDGTSVDFIFGLDFLESLPLSSFSGTYKVQLFFSDEVTSDITLRMARWRGAVLYSHRAYFVSNTTVTVGKDYVVRLDFEKDSGAESFIVWDWVNNQDYKQINVSKALEEGRFAKVSDGVHQLLSTATDQYFAFAVTKKFPEPSSTNSSSTPASPASAARVKRVQVIDQQAGNKSYKGQVPHVITTAGYTTAEVDQPSIDASADAYGDPEMGWLVTSNESADQVLFRLAGSIFSYIWHGLDGKVRSKKLEAPGPVADPFVIDSTNADPQDIRAYDDEAPNLRRSVNALRNWQPIRPDRTAGITSTWTEEDRAKVTADWRITRAWEMGTDGKAEFTRRWPNVASREPLATALRDAITCQLVANQGPDQWIEKPMFYEVPVYVPLGQLSKVAVGETVKAELGYPGLDNEWMLVLGRSGTAQPGMVNLTLWKAGVVPVTLLAPYRKDPRITATRASTGAYFDSAGVLQTAALDELRLDHDPSDNSVKGYLLEDARTNQLLNNRNLSAASWSNIGPATITQNVTGLDGVANTAWTITDDDAGAVERLDQSVTIPNDSNTHSVRIYYKKNSGDEVNGFPAIQIALLGGTTVLHAVSIDTRDGSNATVTSQADGSHTVRDAGDWWEIEIQVTNNSSGNTTLRYSIRPAMTTTLGGSSSNAATGTVAYDFGQVELNAPASSSPIETGATAVTRSADVASITGTNFSELWNSKGAFVVEAIPKAVSDEEILSANDTTTSERISIRARSSGPYQALGVDGGVTQWSLNPPGVSVQAGAPARLALGFDTNDIAFAGNTETAITDDSATMPTPTQLQIGDGALGKFNGHIKYLHCYPHRPMNVQLEASSEVGRDLIREKI